ncbi:MAG: hypothetical protein IH940_06655, partial [Acidobacteria bacterium]|nr:hypothetical protein [Acidobacteriota bacterium]
MPSGLDYDSPLLKDYLKITSIERVERFQAEAVLKEIEELSSGGVLDEHTIHSFTISFEPNQNEFSIEQYGVEFQRVVELASRYGNAVVAIRGHADPTKTLLELVRAGIEKGILKRSGASGNYRYSFQAAVR